MLRTPGTCYYTSTGMFLRKGNREEEQFQEKRNQFGVMFEREAFSLAPSLDHAGSRFRSLSYLSLGFNFAHWRVQVGCQSGG